MTDLADAEQLREQAKQAVDRFVWRFDESYRLLAYHAALPLVLTPELVNYLRNEFLRGEQVPWVAEVDLLLSDLCSQVGYELYAMETHVREYLLEQMQQNPRFGKRRMQEVAQVLYSYVSYLSRLNPGRRQQEIEAQRWAAMVYLGDNQCKQAVREIAQRLIETSSERNTKILSESGIRAELARLVRITEELSSQLEQEPNLLDYARLVQRILRTPEFVTPAELNRSYQVDEKELTFPQRLLPKFFAETLKPSRQKVTRIEGLPQINTFEFEVATVTIEAETKKNPNINLHPFEFEVARIEINQSAQINSDNLLQIVDEIVFTKTKEHLNSVQLLVLKGALSSETYEMMAASMSSIDASPSYLANKIGSNLWKILSEVLGEKITKKNVKNVIEQWVARLHLTIHRRLHQANCFIEDLGNGVQLEMVSIPEGTFIMGSPKDEPERSSSESPQHQVTVQTFFIGKYPVTQAQWQAVSYFPQINQELDPFSSTFQGANRPVENVSWYDAIEFCTRLSQHTGKPYRLPSEAEWEYTCRAGTTTPFHFGETIVPDLANYDANYTYGSGMKGVFRRETTSVENFSVANAFGIYDIHGNVWEWCADQWHENYEGAPTDGSLFLNNSDNSYYLQRGGSWNSSPVKCRAASRNYAFAGSKSLNQGFRIAFATRYS
ncbi:MAG: formylglycine-generating enzyme family protein [Nostoc sp.]